MAHPIHRDAPSKDMTAAQERQRDLDAKIEAFLAKGGEIKAFDTLRRPAQPTEWSAFCITPRPPAPVAAPKVEAPVASSQCAHGIRAPHECRGCEAEASSSDIAKFMDETFPEPEVLLQEDLEPVVVPEALPAEPDEERLAVKIIVEAALGGSPRVIARNLQISLPLCRAIAKQYHVQFHA